MTAVSLAVALVAGIVSELVGGLVARLVWRERRWAVGVTGVWGGSRALLSGGAGRVAVVEAGGAVAALTGSGLAAAAALDLIPGSFALVYLALVLAAAGGSVVGAVPAPGEEPAPRGRRAGLAEPAFAVALIAMFVRFGTGDLDAVRGTQLVLGPGATLGELAPAAGLVLAAAAAAVAGAFRLPALERPGTEPAGTGLLVRLCRWAIAGSTALVIAVFLAAPDMAAGMRGLGPFAGAVVTVAVVLGAVEGATRRLGDRHRHTAFAVTASVAGAIIAAAAGALVMLG